jgi:hypothetical protein
MPPKKSLRAQHAINRNGFLHERREWVKSTLPAMFVNAKLRKAIERLLPVEHYKRLRSYFEVYGCLSCRKKNKLYGANGFCKPCLGTIEKRLRRLDRERKTRAPIPQPDLADRFVRPYRTACELLSDLVPRINPRLGQTKPEPKAQPRVYLGQQGS